MARPHLVPRIGIAVLMLGAGACSDGAGTPDSADVAQADSVTAAAAARWGTGYAISAHALTPDRTVVVTTVGVYIAGPGGGAPSEVAVVETHDDVRHSAVSADGTTLVVVANSPTELRWYDLDAGALVTTTRLGVGDDIRQLEFVGSSERLLGVTQDRVLTWDATTPDAPPVEVLTERVGEVAVLDDGRAIAPLTGTSDLAILDGESVERRTLDLPEGASVVDVHVAATMDAIGVTVSDGANEFDRMDSVHLLSPTDLEPIGSMQFERVLDPASWAVGADVVAVAEDDAVSVVSFDGADPVVAVAVDGDAVQTLAPTEQGFVSIHRSGAVATWSPPDWAPIVRTPGGLALTSIDAHGDALTTVDLEGGITTWSTSTWDELRNDTFASGPATAVAMSGDGERVAVSTAAGRAIVLDAGLQEQTRYAVAAAGVRVDAIEFNPISRQVVTGLAERLGDLAFDDTVTVWDPATGAPVTTIGGESEDVAGCSFFYNRIAFTTDGSLMSTVSHNFSVEIHDGSTGDYVVGLPAFDSTILDTAFSTGGELIVAAADDGSVRVWDLDEFTELTTYRSIPGGLQAFEILPDDDTLVALDLTGRLMLIDLMTGAEISTIAELGGRTRALAVSGDGSVVAAALPDDTVGIWSTSTGARLATLAGHAAAVTGIDFAPDDRLIVTSSADGTVRSWQIEIAAD